MSEKNKDFLLPFFFFWLQVGKGGVSIPDSANRLLVLCILGVLVIQAESN